MEREQLYHETDWLTVSNVIQKINPALAKIIDRLSPDKSFKLFQARYPYGSIIADKGKLFFPSHDLSKGKPVGIETPEFIRKHLKRREFPVSILTKNSAEIFKIMPDRNISRFLINPGGFFGLWENLDPARNEYVKWMWSLSSGARTIYLLPKISNAKGHKKLRKKYGLSAHAPKDWGLHWETFVEIVNSAAFGNKWYNEMVFFSDKWFDTAIKDPAWREFLDYFKTQAWSESHYWRNKTTFDLVWECFLHNIINYNIKFDLFISLIAKQLVLIGMGVLPGFGIANKNASIAPVDQLEKAYIENYQIEYAPLFMAPSLLQSNSPTPIYFSFQYLNLLEAAPAYSKLPEGILSAIPEIKELVHLFQTEFLPEGIVQNSIAHHFCTNVELYYFHSIEKKLHGIHSTQTILDYDCTLANTMRSHYAQFEFPFFSTFLKGCALFRNK